MLRIQLTRAFFVMSLVVTPFMPAMGTAHAQTPHAQIANTSDSVTTSVASEVVWTPADTGRMMPGDQAFPRHTPGMCIAVVERVRKSLWRRHEGDSAAKGADLTFDTLPSAALRAGQSCAAQFVEDDTSVSDVHLRDLMRLRVLLGDRDGARTVTATRLSKVSSDTARGTILFEAVKAELQAKPVHMSSVDSALRRLDDLGGGAAFARLFGHMEVMKYALGVNFDTTVAMRENRAMFALRPLFTSSELDEASRGIAVAAIYKLYVAIYRIQDSTLPSVIDSMTQHAVRELGALDGGRVGELIDRFGKLTMTITSVVGMPAPPIAGTHWYNKPQSATYPEPGKVTLLVEVRKDQAHRFDERFQSYRRLQEKYGSAGFQVVLYATPAKSSWESPIPQSPIDEANTTAWFFLEQLQLPFPLLVDAEIGQTYAGPGVQMWLIGRDGKVRTKAVGLTPESSLEAFVKQALERK